MNDDLRNAVWENMVDADRLLRYHGTKAGKFALQQRVLEIFLAVSGVGATVAAVLLTDSQVVQIISASAALSALYRVLGSPNGRVVEALSCARQLAGLKGEWEALWRQVNAEGASPEKIEAGIQALTARATAATATTMNDRVDEQLLERTESESNAYWTKIAGSPFGAASKAAIASGEAPAST